MEENKKQQIVEIVNNGTKKKYVRESDNIGWVRPYKSYAPELRKVKSAQQTNEKQM
ncbi:MAG: hypothetical protein IJZ26_03655 [Clostridia bacterium]|nr:hypothetical protein [Clostridia bacterium]